MTKYEVERVARELLEFLRDKWGKYDDAGKFEDWLFSDKAICAITKVAARGGVYTGREHGK